MKNPMTIVKFGDRMGDISIGLGIGIVTLLVCAFMNSIIPLAIVIVVILIPAIVASILRIYYRLDRRCGCESNNKENKGDGEEC